MRYVHQPKLKTSRSLAFCVCIALVLTGTMTGQKQNPQQDQKSGTAAKMKNVPLTPVDRDIVSEPLSEPRSGVIQKATVQQNKDGQVRSVKGEVAVPGAGNAREAADKFLDQNADKLGIAPLVRSRDDKTGLRVANELRSLTGTHLTYKQYYEDLPVFDEQIKVEVNKRLQVTSVTNDIQVVPESRDLPVKYDNEAAAIKAAVAAVQGTVIPNAQRKAELGIVMTSTKNPVTVYRVIVKTSQPAAEWQVTVNAKSLKVLSLRNIAQYETANGKIFLPNPVNSSGNSGLDDRNDADYPQLTNEIRSVTLRDLDASGTLTGTYANTVLTSTVSRAKASQAGYAYSRSDNRFDEVMAYYWVTEGTHYVHDLGFTGIVNRSLGIDVDGIPDDNSFYSPGDKQLTFGSGGVHDAQDATIIMHEFGHAILDSQVPGFGAPYSEAGAISEGFGDYWSASFFAGMGPKGHAWDAYVGTWDAVAYNPGAPAFLRRLDGQKTYPKDLDPQMEVHNNGEIWSSHLWEIREQLGKKAADQLIVEAQFKLTPNATFKDNAEAIIKTDGELNAGRNAAMLTKIFTRRGILSTTPATPPNNPPNTPVPVITSLVDQKWSGKDGLDIAFKYQFASGGKATVAVYFSSTDKTYTDQAATWSMNGSEVKITVFNGLFVQTGTIQDNKIKGTSVLTLNKRGEGANLRKVIAIKRSLARAKSDSYDWSASRLE